MVFVTYGKKNTVCNTFWNHLMEFKATAMIKAKKMETGTVMNVNNNVFGTAYLTNAVSRPIWPADVV